MSTTTSILAGEPQAIAALTGTVIPLIVGFLTKLHAPRGLQSALNALLSSLAGGLTSWLAQPPGGRVSWVSVVTTIAITWAISIATHYGLWKPTGISDSVARAAPTFGLGPAIDTTSRPASTA